MRTRIADLMGGEDVLFGTGMGRSCLASLVANTQEPEEPEVFFLDFTGVPSATVSFLREGPLAYRELLRFQGSHLYPVFANLAPAVRDSLGDYLKSNRDALFTCDLSDTGQPEQIRLLGQLDQKQEVTLEAVRAMGEVTAAQLAGERWGGDDVGVTAWNNRLAALSSKGIVMEFREGRRKSFRLPLGVL